jgi:hypothetical protein
LTSIGLFDLLDHLFFLLFCARFLAGHEKGEWGLLASAKGCLFVGEPRNFAVRFVSWGNRKPEGCPSADGQSRSPPCRQRAGGFPISPCPRETGARKGDWR